MESERRFLAMNHRYLPMTEQDKQEMLQAIGVQSIDELFQDIPESVRFKGEYKIKQAKSETELLKELSQLAAKNNDLRKNASFLGAGVYDHYMPIIVGRQSFIYSNSFIQFSFP